MPVGPGRATGLARERDQGTVASADFGNGVATATKGPAAAFRRRIGAEQVVHGGPKLAQADSGPATVPIEITYKPQPVYTDEARSLKLEGEVYWKSCSVPMARSRESRGSRFGPRLG